MANFFKKAIDGLTGKNHHVDYHHLNNGDKFYTIGSFFGYELEGRSLRKYISAYANNPLVFMIINKISTTAASIMPAVVDRNGDKIENQNSKVLEILNNPNPEQGRMELMEEAGAYLLSTGNLFFHYLKGIGMGYKLTTLNPSRMTLKLLQNGEPSHWIYTDNLGNEKRYELEDILHIKTSNIVDVTGAGTYYGLSPLEAAWMVVKASDEIYGAEASIFKNRGIIGILTNETDDPMLEPERRELQKQFDNEVGGHDRYNKIKISNTKLKYIQTGMSPTDLKLIENQLTKLRTLCSIYGTSSILYNDNENSTYNNVAEAKASAYHESYIPLAEKIYKELSIFLSEKEGVQEMVIPDKTTIEAIRATTNEIATMLNNLPPAVANRLVENMTRDEAREILGMDRLEDSVEGSQLVGEGAGVQINAGNNE